MDYIKKTICLEDARTRTQGLMPYYEFGSDGGLVTADGDNGDWGQFVANPSFLVDSNKTYNGMLHTYYSILNMVRNGIKLRKVATKDGDIIFTEDIGTFSCDGGDEPDTIYEYKAYSSDEFSATEIESFKEETRRVYIYNQDAANVNDYVVLIQDFDRFITLSNYLNGVLVPRELSAGTSVVGDEHKKWANYCKVVDACIGKINIPSEIYNKHIKVPKSMPCADVAEYIAWLVDNQDLTGNCCNARLWNDMGGEDMLNFLQASAETKCEDYRRVINGFDYSVPYIEMPLLLVQNFTDVGVLTNIDGREYTENDATRPHNTNSPTGLTIDSIRMSGKRVTYDYDAIEVESLLKTLRSRKKYTDDQDNVLPGIFQSYNGEPGGKYFICTKSGSEWNVAPYTETDLVNGDGMTSEEIANAVGTKFYRTVTTESSAKRISEVYDQEPKGPGAIATDTFYFKVKYENSESKPMTLPYEIGNATNVYLVLNNDGNYIYRGDFMHVAPAINGDKVEFEYVIGGYFRGDEKGKFMEYIGSGDVYYEKHTYDPAHVDYVTLDGVDNVPIYSQYVDFEVDMKEFYSPIYNLYRTGNTANIIEATTGEIWNEKYPYDEYFPEREFRPYDAYLAKEEYLTNFPLPPKVDVNVTIDRGGVSAFEKHYKLSECNTMQDLVNYGNNFFNL